MRGQPHAPSDPPRTTALPSPRPPATRAGPGRDPPTPMKVPPHPSCDTPLVSPVGQHEGHGGGCSDVAHTHSPGPHGKYTWCFMAPVVLGLYLAMAFSFASVPARQTATFGTHTYLILGMSTGIQGLLQFLCQPSIGAISDVIGRKWMMVASLVVTMSPLASLVFTQDMWVYQSLTTASGVLYAGNTLVYAYVSDVTTEANRGTGLGVVSSMFGLAFGAGSLLSIAVMKTSSIYTNFIITAALCAATVVYAIAVLPESISPAQASTASSTPSRLHRMSVCATLNPFRVFRALAHSRLLRYLAAATFFMSTAEQAIISLVIPYCQHRFDFGPSTVSAMAAVMGFGTFFSEAWLFDFALARIGPQRLLIVALLFSATHITLYAIAWSGWVAFAAIFLGPGAFVAPLAVGYMVSQSASPHQQGAMQGVIQGVRALTNGLGPAVFGTLLNVTVYSGKLPRMWQGSAFLVGTVCVLVAVAIAAKLPLSELHAASPQARSSSQHGGAAGGGIMHGHRNEGTNVITSDDGCPSDEDDNCGYSNCSRTPLLPRPCDTA